MVVDAGVRGEGSSISLGGIYDRKVQMRLSDVSSVSFSLDGHDPALFFINELQCDLVVYRNGIKLFRGRIGPSDDDIDSTSHKVSFTATCYRDVLNKRIIFPDFWLDQKGRDQSDEAWYLISKAQDADNGDMGIRRGSGVITGVNRNVLFESGNKVGESIQELSERTDGFEWDVDADLNFNVYYPQRGGVNQPVLDVGGMVTKIKRTVDPKEYANVVRVTGGEADLPKAPQHLGGYSVSNVKGFFSDGERYRYRVTAITPEGETPASQRLVVTIDEKEKQPLYSVQLYWDEVDRATGYNVYGRNMATAPGKPTLNTVTNNGTLKYDTTYRYDISAHMPDGETETVEFSIRPGSVEGATKADNKAVEFYWPHKPGATYYAVYGRTGANPPALLATVPPGDRDAVFFTDDGSRIPNNQIHPNEPYIECLIAANVQTTNWIDTGVSAPEYPIEEKGIKNQMVTVVAADDVDGSAAGRMEVNISDPSLVRMQTLKERAAWYLRERCILRPAYSLTLDPAMWVGPESVWIGDSPSLSVTSGRLSVENSNLRITEIGIAISDNGSETITASLGYKPTNIFSSIRNITSRLEKVERS